MARLYVWCSTLVVALLISSGVYAQNINSILDQAIRQQDRSVEIYNIFDRVYKNFSYVSDRPGEDLWIDYSYRVKKNRRFYGDCDDFAVTIYTLLDEQGYKPRLYTVFSPKDNMYHAIVRVNDLLLDNRFNLVKPWYITQIEYTNIVPWPEYVWHKKVIRIISP